MSGADPVAPDTVPALSLGRTVLFPGMRSGAVLQGARAWAALEAAVERTRALLAVFAARVGSRPGACSPADSQADPFFDLGTLARVTGVVQSSAPCQHWIAEFEGLARVRCLSEVRREPFWEVRIATLRDPDEDPRKIRSVVEAIREAAQEANELFPCCWHTLRAMERLDEVRDPALIPGAVIDLLLALAPQERQRLLETEPLGARLEAVLFQIHRRLAERRPNVFLD